MKIFLERRIFYVLLSILRAATSYRILGFINIAGKSHFNFNHAVFTSLANAGHDVVVVTPFVEESSEANYTIIDNSKDIDIYVNKLSMKNVSEISPASFAKTISKATAHFCDKMMELEQVKKMFQSVEKMFDVIIFQLYIFDECFLPLAEKWNIPAIGLVAGRSLSAADKITSNPRLPSVHPVEVGPLCNLKTDQEFYEKHSKILSPYKEYRKRKPSLVFYNNHFSLFPRALSPNAIEVGGIHVEEEKPLPPLFQKFVDEAEHGVIVFTLGSIFRSSSASNEIQSAFKGAFREIPQRVIWKYEDPMENVPENVLLHKWVPQRDLLAHKNVKAVISHCGLSGVYEFIYSEKPIIATPLFVDQMANARILERLGVAIPLEFNSVTKQVLLDALNRIVNDTRYLRNMQKLSRMLKNRPMTPQQSVVYWTEYVIENDGAPFLQIPAAELYWFQYLLIDVILYVLAIIGLPVYLICSIMKNVKVQISNALHKRDENKKLI